MKTCRQIAILTVLLAATVMLFAGCSDSGRVRPPQASYHAENAYMQAAIDEARDGIYNGDGGPFGCVIVKDGRIVGQGHNCVIADNDSTCHGEIAAIRNAEKNLNTYDLSDCDLYTTGEPCMMCLAASMWANIRHIYYGCTLRDNSDLGFRDAQIDQDTGERQESYGFLEEMDRAACLTLFEEYSSLERIIY